MWCEVRESTTLLMMCWNVISPIIICHLSTPATIPLPLLARLLVCLLAYMLASLLLGYMSEYFMYVLYVTDCFYSSLYTGSLCILILYIASLYSVIHLNAIVCPRNGACVQICIIDKYVHIFVCCECKIKWLKALFSIICVLRVWMLMFCAICLYLSVLLAQSFKTLLTFLLYFLFASINFPLPRLYCIHNCLVWLMIVAGLVDARLNNAFPLHSYP